MRDRLLLGALLLVGVVVPITSCSVTPALTSIAVTPTTETASPSNGLQTDFTAIGTFTRPNHAAVTEDITGSVTWTSANPQMVYFSSANGAGVATVTGAVIGNTTISASAPGFHGDILGTANFIVQAPSGTSGAISLSIVRASGTTPSSDNSVQFTALGRTADGTLIKLAGQPIWTSTNNQIATIDQASGRLTKLGFGRTTITAVYRNPDGTTAVGVTHFNVGAEN